MDFNTVGKDLRTQVHDMHILSPTGEPLYTYPVDEKKGLWKLTLDGTVPGAIPSLLKLVGKDSPPFRRRRQQLRNEIMDQIRGKKKGDPDEDDERLHTIASAVTGWQGIPWSDDPTTSKDGSPLLEFNSENLIKYLKGYPPAAEQANEEIDDRGNFTRLGKNG